MMARRKKRLSSSDDTEVEVKEKEPVRVGSSTGSGDRVCDGCSDNNDSITSDYESQEYQADPKAYAQVLKDDIKARHWLMIVYLDSAPDDWREKMAATGLAFTVSDLHDKDVNPDGAPKKAHYHVIVSYSNSTTYRSVKGLRDITHGPFPLQCKSVKGAYAYFTHKWNPEKYQYDGKGIERYNGWEKALEASDVVAIRNELTMMCFMQDIREYSELVIATMAMDGDYQAVAANHTVYFVALLRSYRHEPLRALWRLYDVLTDADEKQMIANRIDDLRSWDAANGIADEMMTQISKKRIDRSVENESCSSKR